MTPIAPRKLLPFTLLLLIGAGMAIALLSSSAEARIGMCGPHSTYASPGGSDATGDGSFSDPYRSVDLLVRMTPPGGTACLRGGTYEIESPTLAIGKRITLTSYPGLKSRAPGVPVGSERVRVVGRMAVNHGGEDTLITGLTLDGGKTSLTNPGLFADGATLRNNSITNRNAPAICVIVDGYYRHKAPSDVRIQRNRIHHCGNPGSANSSQLDQAVYVSHAIDASITHNWIYDNAARGIQLYPHARGTTVTGNVLDGNGVGLSFGGNERHAASDNLVQGNVITNSRVRWNLESSWAGPVGKGNLVTDNCFLAGNHGIDAGYYNSHGGIDVNGHPGNSPVGYALSSARIADPGYADPGSDDFTLGAGSPCTTKALLGDEPWSNVACAPSGYAPSARFDGGGDADVLTGTEHRDYMEGAGSGDMLNGLGAGDCIRGSDGYDSLIGGYGFDRIFGGKDGGSIDAADGPTTAPSPTSPTP
jgi:hypothetical protein